MKTDTNIKNIAKSQLAAAVISGFGSIVTSSQTPGWKCENRMHLSPPALWTAVRSSDTEKKP